MTSHVAIPIHENKLKVSGAVAPKAEMSKGQFPKTCPSPKTISQNNPPNQSPYCFGALFLGDGHGTVHMSVANTCV